MPTTLVERVCQQCGQAFPLKATYAKRGQGTFCSRLCANLSKVGKHPSEAAKVKMSTFHKAHPNSGEFKKGRVSQNKGMRLPKTTREAISKNHADVRGQKNPMYGKHRSQEVKDAISRAQRKRFGDPQERRKLSNQSRALWSNEGFLTKVISGRAKRPTEPEAKLIDIATKYFPQFKYNGNFDQGVILNYLIPDFVNVNGKKELIEVFGDYFHSPQGSGGKWHRSELGRVMAYNSIGWKCLIIWEHELKQLTEEQLVNKISAFFGRRPSHV